MTRRVLIVFAKAPLPGFAKSRLAQRGERDAGRVAELSEAFLRDTFRNCRRAAPARLQVSFAPAAAADWFRALVPDACLVPQADGPFGERLKGAFRAAFAGGGDSVVLIGADTPHLPPALIDVAFDALRDSPGVIGPACDGGWYLLGSTRRCDGMFDGIEWSTPRALDQTVASAASHGLSLERLQELFDVDTPEDLARLRSLIAADRDLCPATWHLLHGKRVR